LILSITFPSDEACLKYPAENVFRSLFETALQGGGEKMLWNQGVEPVKALIEKLMHSRRCYADLFYASRPGATKEQRVFAEVSAGADRDYGLLALRQRQKFEVLFSLTQRLYSLRNRVFHGVTDAAREQPICADGAQVLRSIICALLSVMERWPQRHWPVAWEVEAEGDYLDKAWPDNTAETPESPENSTIRDETPAMHRHLEDPGEENAAGAEDNRSTPARRLVYALCSLYLRHSAALSVKADRRLKAAIADATGVAAESFENRVELFAALWDLLLRSLKVSGERSAAARLAVKRMAGLEKADCQEIFENKVLKPHEADCSELLKGTQATLPIREIVKILAELRAGACGKDQSAQMSAETAESAASVTAALIPAVFELELGQTAPCGVSQVQARSSDFPQDEDCLNELTKKTWNIWEMPELRSPFYEGCL